jgi:hypothetical protein
MCKPRTRERPFPPFLKRAFFISAQKKGESAKLQNGEIAAGASRDIHGIVGTGQDTL